MTKRISTSRRALLGGAFSSAALLATGCYGSFGLTDMLYDWNTDVSDNKFARALIFFAMLVIPVYALFLFVDAIVLNTIEFWTGKHPVGGKQISKLKGGRELTSIQTSDPDVVRHELRKNGKLERVVYARRVGKNEIELLDENKKVITRGRAESDGSARVWDGAGKPIAVLSASQLDRALDGVRAGQSVADTVALELQAAPMRDEALAHAPDFHG